MIEELPAVEAHKLADWLSKYLDDSWDRQMHNDLATGKLNRFLAKAESDIKANRVRDFALHRQVFVPTRLLHYKT